MPIIESAIQRVRSDAIARNRRAPQLSAYRTAVKKLEKAVAAGEKDTKDLYTKAISSIDHAYSKGLIKKNKAARDKSRMAKLIATSK